MDKQADEAWRKDWAGSTQISQTLSYWSAALEEVRLRELWPCYKSRAQDVRICNLSSSHSRPSTGSYKQPTKIRHFIYIILHFVWQDKTASSVSIMRPTAYLTARLPNQPCIYPKITALRTAAIVSLAVRWKNWLQACKSTSCWTYSILIYNMWTADGNILPQDRS